MNDIVKFVWSILAGVFNFFDTLTDWIIGNPVQLTVPYGNGSKTTTYRWFRVIHVNYHK